MNKISCEDVRLLLSLYIDKMLSDEEMTQVREHLAECDSCQSEYALLKGMMKTTAELPELFVSETFAARLHEALEKEAALEAEEYSAQTINVKAASRVRRWRMYPMIAAGAAVIAISVLAFGQMPKSDEFIRQKAAESSPTAVASSAPETGVSTVTDVVQTAMPATKSTAQPTEISRAENAARAQNVEPEKQEERRFEVTDISEDRATVDDSGADVIASQPQEVEQESSDVAESNATAEGVPLAAALFEAEPEEDKATEDIAEKAFDAAEDATTAEAAPRISEGDSSLAESQMKETVTFCFTEEGLAQAQEILSELESENDGFVVPAGAFSAYKEKLQAVEGYLSFDGAEELDRECLIVLEN